MCVCFHALSRGSPKQHYKWGHWARKSSVAWSMVHGRSSHENKACWGGVEDLWIIKAQWSLKTLISPSFPRKISSHVWKSAHVKCSIQEIREHIFPRCSCEGQYSAELHGKIDMTCMLLLNMNLGLTYLNAQTGNRRKQLFWLGPNILTLFFIQESSFGKKSSCSVHLFSFRNLWRD